MSLSALPTSVKPSRVELTDTPQPVPIRQARGLIRKAKFVAVYVTLTEHGTSDLVDIPKRRALRLIRHASNVLMSVLFGTVVIGRPEEGCERCGYGHLHRRLARLHPDDSES
jgi:hypothetical protein